jgi:hypothetical protein
MQIDLPGSEGQNSDLKDETAEGNFFDEADEQRCAKDTIPSDGVSARMWHAETYQRKQKVDACESQTTNIPRLHFCFSFRYSTRSTPST